MNQSPFIFDAARKYLITLCSLGALFVLHACSNELTSSQQDSLFTDIAADVHLDFEHDSGANGNYLFPEIVGSGGALFDYDNDGDLDIFLVQSGSLARGPSASTTNQLYRNTLIPSSVLGFENVTDEAGLGHSGYGMGVATGDYDNDGNIDLYVSNFGNNVMYHNQGNGQFIDATISTKTDDSRWSTSAAFIDTNHDGHLDLYVATYADYQIDNNRRCEDSAGRNDYCAPFEYPGTTDSLFQNNGDGTFSNVSQTAGIDTKTGPGLGVLGTDFDHNGLVDIFVANDGAANFFWQNQSGDAFVDTGLMSGVAYNSNGKAEASMGVTAGDFDGDGDDDLFMTHLTTETNTLYLNNGKGEFVDITSTTGLGQQSLSRTGFGSRWLDYDNDGDLDLFVANGAVAILNDRADLSQYPYEQANQLFENIGNRQFIDTSEAAGFTNALPLVSRGAAFGDIDNDGDVDILINNNNGPARLLRNNTNESNRAIMVTLVGTTSSKDAQGARIALTRSNGDVLWRRIHADGSYASASDIRVHFGLGPLSDSRSDERLSFEVHWPSTLHERWLNQKPDQSIVLTEGTGTTTNTTGSGLID